MVKAFTKEGCAWDSGLVIVNMESLVMSPWLSLDPIDRSPFGHFKTSVILLVRVVYMYWVFWVVGSNPTVFHINFFLSN